MKQINALTLPEECYYTNDHEWARKEGDLCVIGIDDYAQDQLGDIVYVDLPDVGAVLAVGDEFGTVESVKAVSELYTPLSGEIIAVNEGLEDDPELVNKAPYEGGWMIKIKLSDPSQLDGLMDKAAYLKMLNQK